MSRRFACVFAWLVLAVATPARADQCEWIDPAIAARALAIVQQHPRVVSYCEPCGDATPGKPVDVKAVRVDAEPDEAAEQLASLYVDGAAIDLAYTFVETSPGEYRNLAALAGCSAMSVSAHIHVAPSEPTPSEPTPAARRTVDDDAPFGPGTSVWAEAGASFVHVVPPASITTAALAHATGVAGATGTSTIVAPAFRMRPFVVGWTHMFYAGESLDFAHFKNAQLVDPATGESVSSGWIAQATLVLGVHRSLGPVTFGAELDPGIRSYQTSVERGGPPPLAVEFALGAGARIDAWLVPHLSLGVDAAIDLAHDHDFTAALTLGFHTTPFDATR